MSSILPKLTSIIYKYRQFGFATTFDTVPVQLTAFAPGFSTGNSPVMCSFIRVVPKRHSKNKLLIFRKYRALLRMLPSSTGRSFRRCTEAFPTPSTGGKTHDSPPRHHYVGFFMD